MPYDNTDDLPERVKDNLPKHAQEIFKEAFNNLGMNIKNLEIVKVLPHVKKPLSKLHGLLLNKIIIKTNQEIGRKMGINKKSYN